jgi:hypothetical protein
VSGDVDAMNRGRYLSWWSARNNKIHPLGAFGTLRSGALREQLLPFTWLARGRVISAR